MADTHDIPTPLPVDPTIPVPLEPAHYTPEQEANMYNEQRRKAMGKFAILFLAGFGLGWFFFRNKEQKTKITAGIVGGFALPILLYLTIGRMGFDSAPPPPSVKNFLATFGFGDFETQGSPKGPVQSQAKKINLCTCPDGTISSTKPGSLNCDCPQTT